MTNEIKPERIDELLTTCDRVERHGGDAVSVTPDELRTLLRCYQRVRGLPEEWRELAQGVAMINGGSPLRPESEVVEELAAQLDRAISGEEG